MPFWKHFYGDLAFDKLFAFLLWFLMFSRTYHGKSGMWKSGISLYVSTLDT